MHACRSSSAITLCTPHPLQTCIDNKTKMKNEEKEEKEDEERRQPRCHHHTCKCAAKTEPTQETTNSIACHLTVHNYEQGCKHRKEGRKRDAGEKNLQPSTQRTSQALCSMVVCTTADGETTRDVGGDAALAAMAGPCAGGCDAGACQCLRSRRETLTCARRGWT